MTIHDLSNTTFSQTVVFCTVTSARIRDFSFTTYVQITFCSAFTSDTIPAFIAQPHDYIVTV